MKVVKFSNLLLFIISITCTNLVFAESKEEIDKIRINNLHTIADLVERYKKQTGFYPLEKLVFGKGRSIQVKIGHPPITNSSVVKLKAPHIDEVHFSKFKEDLERALGKIEIPLDPKEFAFDASNFSIYAVYKDSYSLSSILNYYHKHVQVIGKNQFKYEINSNPNDELYYLGLSEDKKNEILKVLPTPTYSDSNRAFALFQNQDFKGAIKYYNKSLKNKNESKDTFFTSYNNLGVAYNRIGEFKLARNSFSNSMAYANSDERLAAAYFNIAFSHIYQNEFDLALNALTEAINRDPRNFKYYSQQSKIYSELNQDGKALESLNKAIEIKPLDSDSLLTRGAIHLKQNKPELAKVDFDNGIISGSKEFNVKLSVAAYFAKFEHKELAINYLTSLLKEGLPDAKKILNNKHFDKIRDSAEFKALLNSIEENPKSPDEIILFKDNKRIFLKQ